MVFLHLPDPPIHRDIPKDIEDHEKFLKHYFWFLIVQIKKTNIYTHCKYLILQKPNYDASFLRQQFSQ